MTGRSGIGRALWVFGFLIVVLAIGLAYPLFARGQELGVARYEGRWYLLALLLVPALLWRGTWGEDRRIPRIRIGTLAGLARGPSGFRVWIRDLPGVIRSVAFGLLVLALARPVNTLRAESTDQEGIDMVVVLDMSGSMQAAMANVPEDLKRYIPEPPPGVRPTRLDAAKGVIRDFIARRKSDRIGVVVFGKSAYVLSPPTLDYHLLDVLVGRMELKLIDEGGTAIGDGVGVAVARLRRSTAKSKAIILLTDGDNNGGRIAPEYAAHLAKSSGVKLYTVQIGQGETAEVQDGTNFFGQPRYVQTRFPVNPKLLKELAQTTGGATYVATDAKSLQASFHDVLNRLEKTKLEASSSHYEELYGFFLLPGVLLLALDALLRSLVQRRFP
jgi:Ca-activated chloride channel family protein